MKKIAALVVLLALLSACFYLFSSGKIYALFDKNVTIFEADRACNLLKEPCEVTFAQGGKITVDIANRPVYAGQSIIFSVHAQGIDGRGLFVKSYGLNMNMGLFEFPLENRGNSLYHANITLPTCIDTMSWKVEIIAPKEGFGAGFVIEL